MATIYVDGNAHEVDPDKNLLESCLSLGYDLPYFCWHPALGSVGACRQCAVSQYKDENDARGRIIMSCMTPSSDGTRIGIADAASKAFRASVIEWLMIPHPHDCPVCEEGGECHLQDMTWMTGHSVRRYHGKKRTFRNQDLGPFLNHEMNRCITCYRCVRFYGDYAGGRDLVAQASKNWVYFGRHADGTLESEFSGNLAEVCPTGVFTDRPFSERYTRKWDLRSTPSVCHHCGVGCNISPNERYGELRRVINRYHGDINGYFICDRGRYGYEYVNSGRRITEALARTPDGTLEAVRGEQALERIATLLEMGKRVIGIGSPLASVEANYALRTLVGAENFYSGFSASEHELITRICDVMTAGTAHTPTLREAERCDAVLILGEDVSNTAPRLALTLRQSARHAAWAVADQLGIDRWNDAVVRNAAGDLKSPFFIASTAATRLDDVATHVLHAAPDDIARLGHAIAHAIDGAAPRVGHLDDAAQHWVNEAAAALKSAQRPLIVSGIGSRSAAVIEAAANIATALRVAASRSSEKTSPPPFARERQGEGKGKVDVRSAEPATADENARALHKGESTESPSPQPSPREGKGEKIDALSGLTPRVNLLYVVHDANATGLALLGGGDVESAFAAARDGKVDTAIILENDLYERASRSSVDAFLDRVDAVSVDYLLHDTAARAAFVLPAGTFAESDGTLVNYEMRAQRFFQLYPARGAIRESWRWLRELIELRRGETLPWPRLDEVTRSCAEHVPALARIVEAAPPASYRIAGMKVVREPPRYSGRTAMHANVTVHEAKPPADLDSPLSFTMEGYYGDVPGALLPFFWAPRWNSHQQAITKFQDEVGGHLRAGDAGVRLCEERGDLPSRYFQDIPSAFAARSGEYLLVPLYHVFGSERLSLHSPGIAQRAPELYLAINPRDARELRDGESVRLTLEGTDIVAVVRLRDDLPHGVAGIPDIPATAGLRYPQRIALHGGERR